MVIEGMEGIRHLTVMSIQAERKENRKVARRYWSGSGRIWRGGTVTSVDPKAGTITIRPWLYDQKHVNGLNILAEWKKKNVKFKLDQETQARHAEVRRWIISGDAEITYKVFADCSITLNGRFVKELREAKIGDRVSVRYRLQHAQSKIIPIDFLKLHRLP
ncbi:MAG: hypothetical protein D6820_18695 [Lentisphaerae bacterium]|nr:MAG: hypothetical protein D6820_18695 [Lentisphaerota bacterium]